MSLKHFSFNVSRAALCAMGLVGSLAVGCAETDPGNDAAVDAGALPANGALDSGTTPTPTPTPTPVPPGFPAPKPDASVVLDASMVLDATVGLDASNPPDAIVPLDANVFNPIPPDTKPADWKLKPGSAPDCPAEPPPIPIIGGLCVGIYFMCGWETSDGRQYSCTCDWVHYLCI